MLTASLPAGYPLAVLETVYLVLLVAAFGLVAYAAVHAAYRIYQGQR